jgi:UDP-2,3-diacylglucosamine pyrophosphatase LpxH
MPSGKSSARHYRTVWISDVHLGFPGCRADFLLDFLHRVTCDRLYLVGDIIDFWHMRRGLYWPQAHNNVVRTVLGKAKHGTEVIYVPGNHDELLRAHDGLLMGQLTVRERAVHETADGRRLLVMHGDEFDSVVKCSRLLALAGSQAYALLLRANRLVNFARSKMGLPYWSLAGHLKHKVKNAVNFISNFESAVALAARRHGADGVVCGHIHRAEISMLGDTLYMNCGDWVESCTALVEHADGKIELLHWSDQQHALKTEAALPALAA